MRKRINPGILETAATGCPKTGPLHKAPAPPSLDRTSENWKKLSTTYPGTWEPFQNKDLCTRHGTTAVPTGTSGGSIPFKHRLSGTNLGVFTPERPAWHLRWTGVPD